MLNQQQLVWPFAQSSEASRALSCTGCSVGDESLPTYVTKTKFDRNSRKPVEGVPGHLYDNALH